jgi:hypothetical protein
MQAQAAQDSKTVGVVAALRSALGQHLGHNRLGLSW